MKRKSFFHALIHSCVFVGLFTLVVAVPILFLSIKANVTVLAGGVLICWLGISNLYLITIGKLDVILPFAFNIVFQRPCDLKNDEERTKWCSENTRGFWFCYNNSYYFLLKSDAMAYKLAWQ